MFGEMVQQGMSGMIFQFLSGIVTMISVTLVPLAIAFSILRYRLWDIDFLINRGVVYACLTLVLFLLFGGLLWGFHEVLKAVLGQHQPPTAAIVISTAAVVTIFRPAHQRFQGLVDRHLYGIQIDYHKPGKHAPSTTETGLRTSIGTYKGLEFIGRGGMSEVYRTGHPTLNRPVAIKILPATLAGDPDFRKRFEREAQMVAGLNHANIVRLYDYGESDGTHYMVMEYIAGPDLSDTIRQSDQLPFERIQAITSQIGSALDYAHQQGLVHRDIKPSNVMLDRNSGNEYPERAVLMDFGIARMISASTRITQSGVIGTLDYMAPEQIRDARDVDRRADIYSLGVMVYMMATGKLPFTASNPGALLIAHLQQPAPDPRILRPEIRKSFAEAVLKAMEKDPANRWQTAGEFASALSA
jgi:serine/threonine protein kinase